MRHRVLGIVGIAVAAVGAWQGDDLAATVAELDDRVTAIEERLEGRPVGTAEAEGLRFEGTGNVVSEPLRFEVGTFVFETAFEGAGFANVSLQSAPGTGRTDVETISGGDSQGTNIVRIQETGDYVLAVSSDGGWVVVLDQ